MNIKRMINRMLLLSVAMAVLAILCGPSSADDVLREQDGVLANKEPLTLADCYRLALRQSETIAINKETIKEAEARYTQSLGTLLPHLSFSSSDTRQDTSRENSLYRRNSSTRSFVLSQQLFSGFKEFAGMSGSDLEKGQRIYEEKRARQLLAADVANAFYLLIEAREDIRALSQIRQALLDRIEELKGRQRLGRSRPSEVVNAKAQLYGVESEIKIGEDREVLARNLLEFITGRKVNGVCNNEGKPSGINSETYYTSRAFGRPDVMAATKAYEVSKKQVAITKSDLLPSVNLQGNYYTQKTAQPKDSDWDATLKVSVPIFNGTVTYGAIQEASALSREAELTLRRTKRLAVQDIKDSCSNFKRDLISVKYLTKALGFAKVNYVLQKKDYGFSLVNNLDVLQSIQTLQETRRNYIRAVYETKRSYWRLQVASGEDTMEKLK